MNIKELFVKYKKYIIGLFILFCIYNFLTGSGVISKTASLPKCNSSLITEEQVPQTLRKEIYQSLNDISKTVSVVVSKPEEIEYDGKAGFRDCESNVKVNYDGRNYTGRAKYQISWINEENNQYQIKTELYLD